MLLITTCRKPCVNTRKFARVLGDLIPNSLYVNRGKKNTHELIEEARHKGFRRIAIITEFKGNPGKIEFIKLDRRNWTWAESFTVKNVVLPKEKTKTEALRVDGKNKKLFSDLFDIVEESGAETVLIADDTLTFKNSKVLFKAKVL
jgi:rRNA maturation protein Rpf1